MVRTESQKKPHNAVHYRGEEGSRRCGNCTMFRPPRSCTDVKFPISASGLCDLFHRKPKRPT